MSTTRAFEAKSLANFAGNAIDFENVLRAAFSLTITKFGQITFMFGQPAQGPGTFRPTSGEITTFARSTCGVRKKRTRFWVATRIVTVVFKAAIALFSGFNEAVSTNWRVEKFFWFVSETVIHTFNKMIRIYFKIMY